MSHLPTNPFLRPGLGATFEQTVDPDGTRRVVPGLDGVDLDRPILETGRDVGLSAEEVLRRFAGRLAYRPGWTFEADLFAETIAIRVLWETDDADRPGAKARLAATIAVDVYRDSLRRVAWYVLGRIRELEDHERLELFRQGSDRLFDPHPHGAALGTEAPMPEVRR